MFRTKIWQIWRHFMKFSPQLWLWPLKNPFGWKWKFGLVWNCKKIAKPYKTSWKASWSQNWQHSTINVMLNHKRSRILWTPIVQPGSFKIHECIPRMFIANSKRSLMFIKVCQNKSIHAKFWKKRTKLEQTTRNKHMKTINKNKQETNREKTKHTETFWKPTETKPTTTTTTSTATTTATTTATPTRRQQRRQQQRQQQQQR